MLVGWAFRTFSRAGEDPNVRQPTSTLVTDGPFAFSRNPMYVTLTVVSVAIALVVNTAWPIIFLPATLVAIHYGVILREERYMERLFGEEYLRYKARVRRWL